MKLVHKLLMSTGLVVMLFITGCAENYPMYAESQRGISQDNQALAAQYFASQSGRDALVMQALSEKGDSSSLVLYSVLQGQQNAQVASAFRSKGLVAPTTGMDVFKATMENTVPTVVKWGFGYLLGSELIDALSTSTYNVGGDFTSFDNNLSAGGDLSGINTTLDMSSTIGLETEPFNINEALLIE